MLAFLFAGLLLPIFSKLLKQKEPVEQLTQFAFLLLIIPTITLSSACLFYKTEIMTLLYEVNTESSPQIFGILMFCFISISITYIFGTLLTANGSLKELNLMAGAGVIINILLNLILIPRFYAYGAAIASMITQSLIAVTQVILTRNILSFKINYKLISLLIIFSGCIYILGLVLRRTFEIWYYGFFVFLFAGIILAFLIRLIKIKSLYQLIRYGKEN